MELSLTCCLTFRIKCVKSTKIIFSSQTKSDSKLQVITLHVSYQQFFSSLSSRGGFLSVDDFFDLCKGLFLPDDSLKRDCVADVFNLYNKTKVISRNQSGVIVTGRGAVRHCDSSCQLQYSMSVCWFELLQYSAVQQCNGFLCSTVSIDGCLIDVLFYFKYFHTVHVRLKVIYGRRSSVVMQSHLRSTSSLFNCSVQHASLIVAMHCIYQSVVLGNFGSKGVWESLGVGHYRKCLSNAYFYILNCTSLIVIGGCYDAWSYSTKLCPRGFVVQLLYLHIITKQFTSIDAIIVYSGVARIV